MSLLYTQCEERYKLARRTNRYRIALGWHWRSDGFRRNWTRVVIYKGEIETIREGHKELNFHFLPGHDFRILLYRQPVSKAPERIYHLQMWNLSSTVENETSRYTYIIVSKISKCANARINPFKLFVSEIPKQRYEKILIYELYLITRESPVAAEKTCMVRSLPRVSCASYTHTHSPSGELSSGAPQFST